MIRYFTLFIILKSILIGCSLCTVYTPRTHISTNIQANSEYIKTLSIKWSFAKEFSNELLQIYDLNLDGTFDDKELNIIKESLLDYLVPRDFITTITYDSKIDSNNIFFEAKDYKMLFQNDILSFEYNIDLNLKIYDKNILKVRIFDKEGFFFIIFEDKKQNFTIPYKTTKSSNISEVSYYIDAPNLDIQKFSINVATNGTESEKKTLYDRWEDNSVINSSSSSNTNSGFVKDEESISLTNKFVQTIKKYLLDIENGDSFALIFLLMVSFLYGVIHSIGPGHGKALAFSYFSSHKTSYFEAFIISLFTAFVHIIGALIIVVFSVFILQNVIDKFLEDSVSYITAFSSIIIMLLAIYILYKKINKKSCSCCSCSVDLNSTKFKVVTNQNLLLTNKNMQVKKIKRDKKQDLLFVLTAGIIPCPGTVLLFVYAFLLKTYFAVFLATISISLGMAIVIFASSFLGVSIHKISSNSKSIVNILEIFAPIFMFILALLLLLNSNSF